MLLLETKWQVRHINFKGTFRFIESIVGRSFVQSKQAPELGGAKTDIADTIMGMLEVAN